MNLKKKPFVSIILNCHNGEEYLEDALISISKQTYTNWELVFWDNRSSDNSSIIFEKFKKKNKKFKYFKAKKFTSLYKARNLAIQKANGDYIAFIDSDDTWEKDKLQKQLKLFKDPSVGVVYGNLWLKNEKNNKIKRCINYKLPEGFIYKNLLKNYYIGIITAVIKKKILNKNFYFNSNYNIIGDFDLFIRLSVFNKFKVIQDPVATYRLHQNNLSSKFRSLQILELKDWLNRQKSKLDKTEYFEFKKKIEFLKFVDFKLEKNFFKTLSFFVNSKELGLSFKNLLILALPTSLLKKYMWFL